VEGKCHCDLLEISFEQGACLHSFPASLLQLYEAVIVTQNAAHISRRILFSPDRTCPTLRATHCRLLFLLRL
jgi:hypothetical protein